MDGPLQRFQDGRTQLFYLSGTTTISHPILLLNQQTSGMTDDIALKYRWRRTWPEAEDDFTGMGGGEIIGRFYKHRAAEGIRWYWHMQWGGNDREQVQLSGLCREPREAAREIETNYDKLRAIYEADGHLPRRPSSR